MQKTNFKTRLLALLTAVFMVVVCVPFAAFAAHSEIVVTFNKGDEKPVQYVLDENKVAPKAPPADGGKWYPNVEGAPVLNGGDSVLYSQMDPYAGSELDGQAFIGYTFKADEKYNKISVSFLNADGGSIDTAKTIAAGESVTAPTKDGDKNIVGWTIGGKAYTGDWSYESLNALVTDDNINSQDKVAYVQATAVYEKEPEAAYNKISVSFLNADGGSIVVAKAIAAGESVTAPAKDGDKNIVGWTIGGKAYTGDWSYESLNALVTDDNINSQDKVAYVQATAVYEKEPEAAYNKISVSFLNAEGGSIVVAKTIAVGESVTAPTKDGDKNITGWTIGGKAYTGDWSYESLNALVTDDDINNLDKVAYVKATAVYEKESETPRKHFNVTFTVDPDKGSFTKEGAGPVEFKGYEDEVGNQQYNVPAVTAKPGYKFVGWKGQGADVIAWDADAKTFGVSGLCYYQKDSNEGYASLDAVFEPTAQLTDIKVNFLKEDGTTVVSAAQYIAKDATLVLPYDVKGVIGWKLANNLTTYDVKTKFSFDDLAAFVGTNYAADGTANLTFYAQYKTEVELKNITIKYVEDKDGVQEDVAAPQNNFTAKDEFTILTDNLYDGKVPAGKKLIGWQYKNGGNTTNFVKGEHVKFDTLKALLNGNWDNEGNAWVTLTPVFQDVKSNNSSSSTSSSSSNKTTTASNEKQVVKAAAAPANTTKVLPKTGASNVAPLLGGSLAVVALLMGYGVYGLVLRKKD